MAKRGRKEKDNWKKKRRQEYLEKKEFRYYIFCEGQATEPKYFQGFKRYIEDNPIYRDMVLIEIEGCQAETMRVIGKAEEYVRENKITKGQIWCVYDKDSFPSSDVNGVVQRAEVLNQKNPDIQYHAAWSNECIEFWFMLHFAYYTANNHRSEYKKFLNEKFQELGIGKYEKNIVDEIKLWLNSDNPVVVIGENIFKCLSGVSYRMSQDMLSEICCQFIDKHYSRWYTDMFKFIANHIDLREMSNDSANELVRHINCVLDNEKEREQIKYSPLFLCVLRRQNYAITEEMDKKIAEYLPSYYGDTYRLEITENENEDMPGFVREYAERIRKSNETQGKNGIFFGHGTREIATVRAILLEKEFVCDSEIIDVLISTVADTLLIFKGKYRYKT